MAKIRTVACEKCPVTNHYREANLSIMDEISTLDDLILADVNNEIFCGVFFIIRFVVVVVFLVLLCFVLFCFVLFFFFLFFWGGGGGGVFYFKLLLILLEYTMEVVGVLVYTEHQQ